MSTRSLHSQQTGKQRTEHGFSIKVSISETMKTCKNLPTSPPVKQAGGQLALHGFSRGLVDPPTVSTVDKGLRFINRGPPPIWQCPIRRRLDGRQGIMPRACVRF